jgi:hypothetical protein
VALSLLVGLDAGRATAAAREAKSRWNSAAIQAAEAQRRGRPVSDGRLVLGGDFSTLGVAPAGKSRLIDEVGRLARSNSLTSVMVTAVSHPEGLFTPVRRLGATQIEGAPYALAVEFVGRFADARKFVNSLPPSVSLWRLDAARSEGGARYLLILSVYELNANFGR